MICDFCGDERDCNEVFKWAGENPRDKAELVCDGCMREIDRLKDIQNATAAEWKEKRTPTEVYARVVGYIRPVNAWNDGKASEYKDRVMFNLEGVK